MVFADRIVHCVADAIAMRPDGRAARPPRGDQPGAAAQAGWVGVEQWRLPRLVSRRQEHRALVRLHLAIPADTRSVSPAEYRFFGIGNGLSSDRAGRCGELASETGGEADSDTCKRFLCCDANRTPGVVRPSKAACCLLW